MTRDDIAKAAVEEARAACAKLTDLQRETLVLSCAGLWVTDIAKMQGVSQWTIADRTRGIREKLGVGSMIEAAVIATKAGLV